MSHLACVRHKRRIIISLDPAPILGVSVIHRADGTTCVSKRVKTADKQMSLEDAVTILKNPRGKTNLSGKKRTRQRGR